MKQAWILVYIMYITAMECARIICGITKTVICLSTTESFIVNSLPLNCFTNIQCHTKCDDQSETRTMNDQSKVSTIGHSVSFAEEDIHTHTLLLIILCNISAEPVHERWKVHEHSNANVIQYCSAAPPAKAPCELCPPGHYSPVNIVPPDIIH